MALFEHDDPNAEGFHFHESRGKANPYPHKTRGAGGCVDECPACIWLAFGMNPYGHELNVHGMACADDCPACAWIDERVGAKQQRKRFEMKERLGYPTELVTPTAEEHGWLKAQNISWAGDLRTP